MQREDFTFLHLYAFGLSDIIMLYEEVLRDLRFLCEKSQITPQNR